MSWVTGGAPAGFDELVALRPGLAADLAAFDALLWSGEAVPAPLLELARLRIAQLVGCDAELAARTPAAQRAGLDESRVARLAQWPTDPATTPAEHACLALAEQVVIDPHGVTGELVDAVRAALGDAGAAALAIGLAVFEGRARAAVVLGAAAPPVPAQGD